MAASDSVHSRGEDEYDDDDFETEELSPSKAQRVQSSGSSLKGMSESDRRQLLKSLGSSGNVVDASMIAAIRLRTEHGSGSAESGGDAHSSPRPALEDGNVVTVAGMRWEDAGEAAVAGARIARAIKSAFLRRKRGRHGGLQGEEDRRAQTAAATEGTNVPSATNEALSTRKKPSPERSSSPESVGAYGQPTEGRHLDSTGGPSDLPCEMPAAGSSNEEGGSRRRARGVAPLDPVLSDFDRRGAADPFVALRGLGTRSPDPARAAPAPATVPLDQYARQLAAGLTRSGMTLPRLPRGTGGAGARQAPGAGAVAPSLLVTSSGRELARSIGVTSDGGSRAAADAFGFGRTDPLPAVGRVGGTSGGLSAGAGQGSSVAVGVRQAVVESAARSQQSDAPVGRGAARAGRGRGRGKKGGRGRAGDGRRSGETGPRPLRPSGGAPAPKGNPAAAALGPHRSPSSADDRLLDDVVAALVSTRGVDFGRVLRNLGAAPAGGLGRMAGGGGAREGAENRDLMPGSNTLWTEPPRGNGSSKSSGAASGAGNRRQSTGGGMGATLRVDGDGRIRGARGGATGGGPSAPPLAASFPALAPADIHSIRHGRWAHEYAAAYGAAAGAAAMTAMKYSESIGDMPGGGEGASGGLTGPARSAMSGAVAGAMAELLGDPQVIRLVQAATARRLATAYEMDGVGSGGEGERSEHLLGERQPSIAAPSRQQGPSGSRRNSAGVSPDERGSLDGVGLLAEGDSSMLLGGGAVVFG